MSAICSHSARASVVSKRRAIKPRIPLAAAISSMLLWVSLSGQVAAQSFTATIELADLDGNRGFKLNGEGKDHFSGRAVNQAGDINGDGSEDVIISAHQAAPNGDFSGRSYIVFGRDTKLEHTQQRRAESKSAVALADEAPQ